MTTTVEYLKEQDAKREKAVLEDLRDWMAMAAMNAFIGAFMKETNCGIGGFVVGYWGNGKPSEDKCSERVDSIAKASYNVADAMLEVRQKTQEDPSESS